jgi:hypothetical protein
MIKTRKSIHEIRLNFSPMILKNVPRFGAMILWREAGTKTVTVNSIPPIQKIADRIWTKIET